MVAEMFSMRSHVSVREREDQEKQQCVAALEWTTARGLIVGG